MMKNSIVSVIVPVYRVEKFLRQCINSILCQSYKNIEVVLVDDGSPDRSGEICDEYALKDSRVKVIHQTNGGVSLARYNGVMGSSGEWAFFVDADDYILPQAIEKLINNAEGFDLVSATYKVTDCNLNNPCPHSQWIKEEGVFSGEEYVIGLLNGTRLPNICRLLIRMNILKNHYILIPKEIRLFEDFLLNVNLGLYLSTIKGIPDVIYYYRMQEESAVHTLKQSLSDADLIDHFLEEILKDKNQFQEALFTHRIRDIKRFITDPHLNNASFVKKAIDLRNKYPKRFSDRLALFLCNKNVFTRKFTWNFFLFVSKNIVFLKKISKKRK